MRRCLCHPSMRKHHRDAVPVPGVAHLLGTVTGRAAPRTIHLIPALPLFPVGLRLGICLSSRGGGAIRRELDSTSSHGAQDAQAQAEQKQTYHHGQAPSMTGMGGEAGRDARRALPAPLCPSEIHATHGWTLDDPGLSHVADHHYTSSSSKTFSSSSSKTLSSSSSSISSTGASNVKTSSSSSSSCPSSRLSSDVSMGSMSSCVCHRSASRLFPVAIRSCLRLTF